MEGSERWVKSGASQLRQPNGRRQRQKANGADGGNAPNGEGRVAVWPLTCRARRSECASPCRPRRRTRAPAHTTPAPSPPPQHTHMQRNVGSWFGGSAPGEASQRMAFRGSGHVQHTAHIANAKTTHAVAVGFMVGFCGGGSGMHSSFCSCGPPRTATTRGLSMTSAAIHPAGPGSRCADQRGLATCSLVVR